MEVARLANFKAKTCQIGNGLVFWTEGKVNGDRHVALRAPSDDNTFAKGAKGAGNNNVSSSNLAFHT